ncbi:hypothetical protein FOA52_016191 [Chlamydomonas sp. UWO 241]|nr:hypothetical protein FOA52_016191 [Chlamydomonas sp. UWO 241]
MATRPDEQQPDQEPMQAAEDLPDNDTRYTRCAHGNAALLARWRQDPRYVPIEADFTDLLDALVELGGDWAPFFDSRFEIVQDTGQRCIVQIMGGDDGFIDDGEMIVDPRPLDAKTPPGCRLDESSF